MKNKIRAFKNYVLQSYFRLFAYLAKKYLDKHKPLVIGINGSVGKTSCRMIVYQTLQKFFPTKIIYTSPKNFNGELWLPLSIFQIESWEPTFHYFIGAIYKAMDMLFFGKMPYDILILEYGVDHPGEMDLLLRTVKPDIGIFTAIDAVHSEQFGDPGAIARDEIKMIQATKDVAFLNHDDPYAMSVRDTLGVDVFVYQTQWHEPKSAHIWFKNELFVRDEDDVYVTFDLHVKNKKVQIQTNVFGKAHYGYIGVSFVIADIIAHKWSGTTVTGHMHGIVMDYDLQPGRMSIFAGYKDSIVIDSSYNASPLSVRKVIDTAHRLQKQLFKKHKMWLVLWDMRELGDLTEKEHRLLAAYVHQVADQVFLVGQSMKDYMYDELEKIGYDMAKVQWFSSSMQCGDTMRAILQESDDKYVLVFKGSQNTIFLEEAIKHVLYDPADIQKLVRQGDWWAKKKKLFFGEDL